MTPFISKVGMETRESALVAVRLRLKADRFRNGWKKGNPLLRSHPDLSLAQAPAWVRFARLLDQALGTRSALARSPAPS